MCVYIYELDSKFMTSAYVYTYIKNKTYKLLKKRQKMGLKRIFFIGILVNKKKGDIIPSIKYYRA